MHCTIYDCEFDLHHKGIIIEDDVYALDKKGNKQDLFIHGEDYSRRQYAALDKKDGKYGYIDQKIYIKDGAVSKYEKAKD